MPPIFRIMGGHGRNRQTQQTNDAQNNPQQQQPPVQQEQQQAPPPQQAAPAQQQQQQPPPSRYTYPGMRAAANSSSNSTPAGGMRSLPNTTGTMGGSAPPAAAAAQSSGGASRSTTNNSTAAAAASSTTAAASNSSNSNNNAARTNNNGSSNTTNGTVRPGAYQVTRTTAGPAIVYRVTIPPGISPGAEFHVHAGQRRVRVRCPPTSRPGQSLQITLPPEPVENQRLLKAAPLTACAEPGGGAVAMTPEVAKVNMQAEETGGSARSYLVDIPPNVYPGQAFTVNVAGQRFMVTCPPTAGPNMKIRIVPPTVREEPEAAPKTQVFEVSVPTGVQPGQPFALVANGQRVLVTCPPNVVAGQKIRFQLPVSQVVSRIQLAYESNVGWSRTIRVSDMKFQWIRMDNEEADEKLGAAIDVESMERFDFKKSAYVRKITYLEGNDARMRTGRVSLVPANEAVVDSKLVVQNRTLLSYADIAEQQEKPLEEKSSWFQNICSQLTAAWEDGRIKVVVRRKYLLHDSVDAIMSLSREDMRKRWRVEFLGEPGIDAGGVSREWFELVTEQVFDPAFGLFISSMNNQMSVEINPASGTYGK